MNEERTVTVVVTAVRPPTAPTDTVVVGKGTVHGMPITFGIEPRMADDMRRALADPDGAVVIAVIPTWAVLAGSN
jgi:hypothetical protein